MKRIKYIIVITLTLIMLVGINAQGENYLFSIDEAQKTAIENYSQTRIDDLNIKLKEDTLKHLQEDIHKLGSTSTIEGFYNNKIKTLVNPLKAEAALEVARMTKQDNIESLKLDVYKTALGLLLAGKELEKENQKLSFLEEKYKIAKAKYDANIITEAYVEDAQYALDGEKITIGGIEDKIASYSLGLKKLLNQPLDNEIVNITDTIKYVAFKNVDIDKAVQDSLQSNTNIYRLTKALEAAEKAMELTKEIFGEGDSTYDSNSYSLETARLDLEEAKVDLEVNIRNKYNNLLSLKDSVMLAQTYEGMMNKRLKAAEIRCLEGIINMESLLGEKENYLDAVYQKYLAIYDYNVAKAEFDNLISK